ncbi:MAG TPA: sulfurtransferase [Steroidobacteraceae bacterium]|nr:sulfurtransferase [Steroidobacteraceae bacterium]
MTTWADDAPLIAAERLRALPGAPHLLVVDCRHDLASSGWGRGAWTAGHIPGAVFASTDADLSAPRHAGSGRHPLPAPRDFAATLGRWGFTPATHVVAYDQGGGIWASRLWWLLRARGHARVQVLDGGMAAWLAAGGALDTAAPRIVPTSVETREFAGAVSTAEVARLLAGGDITLFDARAADRFAGRNETVDPVPGHVPGARSMPCTGNLGPEQRFLPAAALRERWAGLASGAPLVAMCGSGISACHNLLALELAGFPGARLYAGSYSEWIADPARPVATGSDS